MSKITCSKCGKRYDYHDTEFCPKCWVYNRPKDSSASHLEYDLLSRIRSSDVYRAAQEGADRATARRQPGVKRAGVVYHAPAARPQTGRPGPAAPRRSPAEPGGTGPASPVRTARDDPWENERSFTAPAREGGFTPVRSAPRATAQPVGKPRKSAPLARVVTVIIFIMLIQLVFFIAGRTIDRAVISRPAPDVPIRATERDPLAEPGDRFLIPQYAEFGFDRVRITVEEAWWLDIPSDSPLFREGERCLLVDVWIEDGTRRDDLYFSAPYLLLEEEKIPLVEDIRTKSRLKDQGVYPITLSDYQWEDPLFGQFAFYVPEEAVGAAALVLENFVPGTNPARIGALYEVAVELPGQGQIWAMLS